MKKEKTYKVDGKIFRYDNGNALLCWIDDDGEIIDSIGLSRDDWAENPEYWCEMYVYRLEEELRYLY